ncbi:MAG: hypothetical protein ACI38Q_04205, partial [Candidatus Bruticola sp.]
MNSHWLRRATIAAMLGVSVVSSAYTEVKAAEPTIPVRVAAQVKSGFLEIRVTWANESSPIFKSEYVNGATRITIDGASLKGSTQVVPLEGDNAKEALISQLDDDTVVVNIRAAKNPSIKVFQIPAVKNVQGIKYILPINVLSDNTQPAAKAEDKKPTAAAAKAEDKKPTAAAAKAEDKKPAAAAKAEDKKPAAAAAKAEDKKPAAAAKAEDKKPVAAATKAEDKKPAAAAAKAEDKKPAAAAAKAEDKKPAAAAAKAEDKKPAAAAAKAEDKKPATAAAKAEDKKPATAAKAEDK